MLFAADTSLLFKLRIFVTYSFYSKCQLFHCSLTNFCVDQRLYYEHVQKHGEFYSHSCILLQTYRVHRPVTLAGNQMMGSIAVPFSGGR